MNYSVSERKFTHTCTYILVLSR